MRVSLLSSGLVGIAVAAGTVGAATVAAERVGTDGLVPGAAVAVLFVAAEALRPLAEASRLHHRARTGRAARVQLEALLAGFAGPDSGSVARRCLPALVGQDAFLFSGTVADNLRLAAPDADDAELVAALGRADVTAVRHHVVLAADQVAVPDGGRVVEAGPPHELVARGERLAQLLADQLVPAAPAGTLQIGAR